MFIHIAPPCPRKPDIRLRTLTRRMAVLLISVSSCGMHFSKEGLSGCGITVTGRPKLIDQIQHSPHGPPTLQAMSYAGY